ncbi:MAG: hypothetical protein K2Y56_25805 [Methylobacterium sp.]|uniref:ribosome modulation factor n=1 Tax=Methylobacterium sp. TaxID=409 RepID=UPI0025CD9CCA|nr:hypothetical protein [Methylobacterium sp.]MBX9934881.1 hypothetical protein [Methylobacterium sp.]
MASTTSQAWNEGKGAKTAGQPHSVNPYPAGSQESADWLTGYTDGEREQNVDQPQRGEG